MPNAALPFAAYLPRLESRPEPVTAVLAEATERDLPHLAALQVGLRGGTVQQWSRRIGRVLAGETSAVVLARVDGVTAGYANVAFLPGHPEDGAPGGYYLTGVTVAPRWRRRGVGAALTRWRMVWAWERGPEVWCFVSSRNRASLDLHHVLGFREVRRAGILQGVAFDGGEGVLLQAQRPA